MKFLIFSLRFLCYTRKIFSELHKASVIKNPLGQRYSLFLRYSETTLIAITSMNLSWEMEKSIDFVFPPDATQNKARMLPHPSLTGE